MGNEIGERQEPVRERVESTLVDLTPDERTILEIAYQGESLAAIGRWEHPIKGLVARGLMVALDFANNIITDAGRKAFETADDKVLGEFVDKVREVANSHAEVQRLVTQAAEYLRAAALLSTGMTGDSAKSALHKWAKEAVRYAEQMIPESPTESKLKALRDGRP